MGKLAVITGTSSGIGEALAGHLLGLGWKVFGIARREVKRPEMGYRHIQADLSDLSVAESIVAPALSAEMAFSEISRLALVNNAASPGQMRNLEKHDANTLGAILDINITAPMLLMGMMCRVCPPDMPLRLVNLSSGLASFPLAGAADYCASKSALRMAGEVMALELENAGRQNAAVFSYEPGIVETEMQEALRTQEKEHFSSTGMFRSFHSEDMLAGPHEVIDPIVRFLEDDHASGFSESRHGNV